jgi:hypothetical protein
MYEEGDDHKGNDSCVYLQENCRQQRYPNLGEHQQVKRGFLGPTGGFDMSGAMAEPIGASRRQPDRQYEIQQYKDSRVAQHGMLLLLYV